MKPLRAVAVEMAQNGEIVILRKNKPADPTAFRGVYRLALPDTGMKTDGGTA